MRHGVGKRIQRCWAFMLAAVVFLLGVQTMVYAEEKTVHIPVTQEFSSNVSDVEDEFWYVLEAETEGAPMPERSENGEFSWNMSGNDSRELSIAADQKGTYVYKLYQRIVDGKKNYEYDRKIYKVTLYVYGDGESNVPEIVIIQNASGEKSTEAAFKNQYREKLSPQPPQNGKLSQSGTSKIVKTGDSSNIQLYVALMVVSVFVLLILRSHRRRYFYKEESES